MNEFSGIGVDDQISKNNAVTEPSKTDPWEKARQYSLRYAVSEPPTSISESRYFTSDGKPTDTLILAAERVRDAATDHLPPDQLEALLVIGSYTRGTQKPTSDLDFIVKTNDLALKKKDPLMRKLLYSVNPNHSPIEIDKWLDDETYANQFDKGNFVDLFVNPWPIKGLSDDRSYDVLNDRWVELPDW